MEASSILMFVLVAGFVWGGFLTVLTVALRKEGAKSRADTGGERPPGPAR